MIMDGWGHGVIPPAMPFTRWMYRLLKVYMRITPTASWPRVAPWGCLMSDGKFAAVTWTLAPEEVYQELLRINLPWRRRNCKNPFLCWIMQRKTSPFIYWFGLWWQCILISITSKHYVISRKTDLQRCLYMHLLTDAIPIQSGYGFYRLAGSFGKLGGRNCFCGWKILCDGQDNRWQRVKLAYDLMVHGEGKKTGYL